LLALHDVSPDGKSLLYSVVDQDRNSIDLMVVSLEGGSTPTKLCPGLWGVFSRDGSWLAYISRESGKSEVYVRPFRRPGAVKQVSKDGGGSPCWSPLENRLFYHS